ARGGCGNVDKRGDVVHRFGLRGRTALFVLFVGALVVAVAAAVSVAAGGGGGSINSKRQLGSEAKAADGADEILGRAAEYAAVRTAPAATVSAAAVVAARQQASALSSIGTWTELPH